MSRVAVARLHLVRVLAVELADHPDGMSRENQLAQLPAHLMLLMAVEFW
jgi:hypothetical protein